MINIIPHIPNKKHAFMIVALLTLGCLGQSPALECDYTVTVEEFNEQGYNPDEVLEDMNKIIFETEKDGEKAYCIKFGEKQENGKTVAKPEAYDEGNVYIPHHRWDDVVIKVNSDDEKRAFNDLLDYFEITDEYGRKKFIQESDEKTLKEIEKEAKEYRRDLEKFEENFKEYVDNGLDYELAREQMHVDFGPALDSNEKEVIEKIMKFENKEYQKEMYRVHKENEEKFDFLFRNPEIFEVFFELKDSIANEFLDELLEKNLHENMMKGLFNGAAQDSQITKEDLEKAKHIVEVISKDEYVLNLMKKDTSVERPIVYLSMEENQIIVDKGMTKVVEITPGKTEVGSICVRKGVSSSCLNLSTELKKTKGNVIAKYSIDENDEVNLVTYSKNGVEQKFHNWHNIKSLYKSPKEKEVSITYINGKKIKIEGEFINVMYISIVKTIYTAPPEIIIFSPPPALNEPMIYSTIFIDTDGDDIPDMEVGFDDHNGGYYWFSYFKRWKKDYEDEEFAYVLALIGSHKKDEMEKFKNSENIHQRIMYLVYKSGILEEFLEQYPPPRN